MSESTNDDAQTPGRRRSDSDLGAAQPGRRASDRIDARGVARMIEVLASRPSPDDLARELALGTLARFKSKTVMLAHLASSAELHLVGSFGLSNSDLSALSRRSIWDGSVMSEALRTGAVVKVASQQDSKEGAWENDLDEALFPIVALPLILQGRKIGALGIGVDQDFADVEFYDELSGIGDVLALYLSMRFEAPPPNQDPSPASGHENTASVDDPSELPTMTDRRREVLRLLAMGMTNSQIAHRIGYSESTVRHETIALYRMLGAKSRTEASRIAETRGLLNE